MYVQGLRKLICRLLIFQLHWFFMMNIQYIVFNWKYIHVWLSLHHQILSLVKLFLQSELEKIHEELSDEKNIDKVKEKVMKQRKKRVSRAIFFVTSKICFQITMCTFIWISFLFLNVHVCIKFSPREINTIYIFEFTQVLKWIQFICFFFSMVKWRLVLKLFYFWLIHILYLQTILLSILS